MLATWVLTTSYGFGVAYLYTTDDIAVTLEPKAADDGKYISFLPSPVVDRQGNDCFTKALSQLWCQEQTPIVARFAYLPCLLRSRLITSIEVCSFPQLLAILAPSTPIVAHLHVY